MDELRLTKFVQQSLNDTSCVINTKVRANVILNHAKHPKRTTRASSNICGSGSRATSVIPKSPIHASELSSSSHSGRTGERRQSGQS